MSSLRKIFPKEALDKAIGTTVWIIMRDDQELRGTLKSFDDHINMVSESGAAYIKIIIINRKHSI